MGSCWKLFLFSYKKLLTNFWLYFLWSVSKECSHTFFSFKPFILTYFIIKEVLFLWFFFLFYTFKPSLTPVMKKNQLWFALQTTQKELEAWRHSLYPSSSWRLSLNLNVCEMWWDVMTASVASGTWPVVQHRDNMLSSILLLAPEIMPETNLWLDWRRRSVYKPFCYGRMSKDANLRKVHPWYFLSRTSVTLNSTHTSKCQPVSFEVYFLVCFFCLCMLDFLLWVPIDQSLAVSKVSHWLTQAVCR